MPEKDLFYINEKTRRRVYCNRFNIWDKLAQHYYVEQLSRMIDGRLEYQRYLNNTHLKGIPKKTNNNFDSDSSESEDEYDEEDLNNKKTILGESMTGSNRHLRKLSLRGLHVVQKKGRPHIFLTLTCDSEWPEITEKLGKNQTAYSRPDITNMVFHERLEALLHNLRHGKYFKFTVNILKAKQYIIMDDPENDSYTGHYEFNEYHDYGKLEQTVQNSKVTYSGYWKNGIRHGYGELIQPYNVKFNGEFMNNIPNGEGTLIITRSIICTNDCEVTSNSYEVLHDNSKMLITTTRNENLINIKEVYIGVWIDGILFFNEENGKKRRVQYDGVIYCGIMDNNNVANGQGYLLFPDGTKYEGTWSENEIVKSNKVEYEMRVIEYQHRGLPHCHYVARLTNMPKAECMLMQWVDENISTEGYYDFDKNNKNSPEYELKEIIRNKMIHKCRPINDNNPRGCLKDDGTCKKFYHAMKETETSFLDSKGFPKYKRKSTDLNIVPYNPLICLDWGGHANLEFTELSYSINYLYKYIFKGNTKIRTEITEKKNEITCFLKTRKICSMDAVNRFLGYPTYPQPNPSVKCIKVKLPDQVSLLLYEGKLCDLFVYFLRPENEEFKNLKYEEFFEKYTYVRKTNENLKANEVLSKRFNEDVINPISRKRKKVQIQAIIKRRRNDDTIIMLQGLSIRSGEICYLRMLLKHKAAQSFQELLTFKDNQYITFQDSAREHGFLKDMEFLKGEFLDIFDKFTDCSKRRMMFAIWLAQDYPVNFMVNNFEYTTLTDINIHNAGYLYKEMVMDWMAEGKSKAIIKNLFLTELDKYLNDNGLNNTIFGLPKPIIITSEVQFEKFKYKREEELERYKRLEEKYPSNEKQKKFIDHFKTKFKTIQDNDEHPAIFMYLGGSGGTGKSNVLEKIAAYVRSQGCICKVSAATALAASIYDDATTFHSLAKIPVIEECDRELEYSLNLNLTKERLELLLETKVIIIDEIFFSHRENLETFCYEDKLNQLKGKIILAAGDWKQFLPISEGGTKDDQLSITLSSSPLWKKFQGNIFILIENMRLSQTSNMNANELKQQKLYASILEDIGNQTNINIDSYQDATCTPDEKIYKLECSNKYIIHDTLTMQDTLNDSLSFLYEGGFTQEKIMNSAVICGTNKLVNMWNEKIQKLNENDAVVFYSNDSLADIDDEKGYIKEMLSTRVLNNKNHSSAPPHELRLKVNDICILTR